MEFPDIPLIISRVYHTVSFKWLIQCRQPTTGLSPRCSMTRCAPGAPDGNPVVDPVPPTNHRVITTVLYDATMPEVPKIVPARRDRNPAITRTGS